MIDSVGLTTGPGASLTDPWRREASVRDDLTDQAVSGDTQSISQGARQRGALDTLPDISADQADQALAAVREALSGQDDLAGLHSLSADRVMQLVGLAV